MTRRIFRAAMAVALAAMLAGLALIVGVLHAYFEQRVAAELRVQAVYIAYGLRRDGAGFLTGDFPDGSRVTWVAPDGSVRFDSQEDAGTMENHADRPEIRQALQSGEGSAARYSDTLAQRTVAYAVRLDDGSVLRVSDTQYSVWMLVAQVIQPVALVMLLTLVLAAGLAGRVARQIVRPINAIDLNDPGDDPTYDELTPLLARIRAQNRQIRAQMDELRRRQEEFAAVTENMGEGLVILDGEQRVLFRNAAARRLLDAAPAGQELYTLDLSREAGFRDAVDAALVGRRCERLLERDGRCRQIIASPVQQDGRPAGAVLLILDVTEREQREGLRREFTANVSHELKTPLTAISGTAELLEAGLVKPEDLPRFAGNIRRGAARLLALVNDIIRLSRLDEGGPAAETVPVELRALARRALEQLADTAREKDVRLELRDGEASVRTDPQLAAEIVSNLCDNAVAYNRPGGSVTVAAEAFPDGGARLTVADTGIGIPAAARERVFERFYRVDPSRSSGGTGLGLSIVRHAAAALGASVELKSREGAGSTFTVTFPGGGACETGEDPAAEEARQPEDPAGTEPGEAQERRGGDSARKRQF